MCLQEKHRNIENPEKKATSIIKIEHERDLDDIINVNTLTHGFYTAPKSIILNFSLYLK